MQRSERTKFPKHRASLLTGFRLRSDAPVLLVPRGRLNRAPALVRPDRRTIAGARDRSPGIIGIPRVARGNWSIAPAGKHQGRQRQKREPGKPDFEWLRKRGAGGPQRRGSCQLPPLRKHARCRRNGGHRQDRENAHPEILHIRADTLVARPSSFTRALARALYAKDLGGLGGASGSIPVRIDAAGCSTSTAFKRHGNPRTGCVRMAGTQHENPLAQQPAWQGLEVAPRPTSAAPARATDSVCSAFSRRALPSGRSWVTAVVIPARWAWWSCARAVAGTT